MQEREVCRRGASGKEDGRGSFLHLIKRADDLLLSPPQGLSRASLRPLGLRPRGFFFPGIARWRIGWGTTGPRHPIRDLKKTWHPTEDLINVVIHLPRHSIFILDS